MPQEKIRRSEFAIRMGVSKQNVTRWIKEGKLNGCFSPDFKHILWPKGRDQVNKLLNPLQQKKINKHWDKPEPPGYSQPAEAQDEEPAEKKTRGKAKEVTPEEVERISNKAGFEGGKMSMAEAQRLKLQYEAGIKKLEFVKMRNQLIDADVVKRESFSAGLQIREGLESIADRCAPLVAATNDQFECREILAKEINHILTGLADALQVSQ